MYTTTMKCGMRLMLLTLHYMTSILIQHIFKIQHSSKVYQKPGTIESLKDLRVMGKFGDSVTTDHISPEVLLVKIHQQVNTY